MCVIIYILDEQVQFFGHLVLLYNGIYTHASIFFSLPTYIGDSSGIVNFIFNPDCPIFFVCCFH